MYILTNDVNLRDGITFAYVWILYIMKVRKWNRDVANDIAH